MSTLGTGERPLRVAIVGSGPSGFYAADALLKSECVCTVDVFDRLPTPFGLVRNGVAPDHPKIRNVTKVYDKIAANEHFTFFGNVKVGEDIGIGDLRRHYDAIILAYGAETDRRMGIPGEDLPGSHPATIFVGWYNGHPDYRDLDFDLSHEVAIVVGVGNVAMDVARILAKTVDELKNTDIAQHALEVLAESKVKEIHVVARRGPAQVKFTLPELKELGKLEGCEFIIEPASLELDPVSEQEKSERNVGRLMQTMVAQSEKAPGSKSKRLYFRFLESPVELKGADKLESVVLEKNKLAGEVPFKLKARGTGERTEMPCGLLFRSIGYNGVAIPGVPFHESWGIIPSDGGRVTEEHEGPAVPGLYCVGWIKRGPSGVIGTNKPCSIETANKLLEDLPNLTPCETPDSGAVAKLIEDKGVRIVTLEDWRKIDAAELEKGAAAGKPRERFTRINEMLEVL